MYSISLIQWWYEVYAGLTHNASAWCRCIRPILGPHHQYTPVCINIILCLYCIAVSGKLERDEHRPRGGAYLPAPCIIIIIIIITLYTKVGAWLLTHVRVSLFTNQLECFISQEKTKTRSQAILYCYAYILMTIIVIMGEQTDANSVWYELARKKGWTHARWNHRYFVHRSYRLGTSVSESLLQ